MWFKQGDKDDWERYDNLKIEMRALIVEEVQRLRTEMDARLKPMPEQYQERLAEAEVKLAKLWGLLVKTSPTGKEGLSKHGRLFGGAARDRL